MTEVSYFAICPVDGWIEWFELSENEVFSEDSTKTNYLKSDGSIAYPNKYERLKKKNYIDIVCSKCECPMVLIPFDACDVKQRKKIYNMVFEERKKFAERFELVDSLED